MSNRTKLNRGGDLWRLRVRIAGRDHYRHMHGSAAQADAALIAFAESLESRGAPPHSPATLFRVQAEDWLARHAKALEYRTVQGYRAHLDNHLLPAIGAKRLNRITAADGLALQRALGGHAPATIAKILGLGRQILADAVTFNVLPANPWAAVKQTVPHAEPRQVMQPGQFAAIASQAPDTELSELFLLLFASGLRLGEALGLRWQDVDLAACRLTVAGVLEQRSYGEVAWKSRPKTHAGRRTIALPGQVIDMLRRRHQRAAQRPEATGPVSDTGPVFPAPDGLSWANPAYMSQRASRMLHAGGIADSAHGARHAHITALLSAGHSPNAVSARAGHRKIETTLGVYGHVLPRDEAAIIESLDKVFPE